MPFNAQSLMWGNNPSNTNQDVVPNPGAQPAEEEGVLGGMFDGMGWMDKVGPNGMKTQGGLGLGLNAAQGLFNGWMGMKKLGLAKDQLKENKRQFNMNWGAQKKTVNNQLHNAQIVRNGSEDPSKNQDMGQYMNKWGIQ